MGKELNLTKDEAYNLAEMIEDYLFDTIREDTDLDNIYWLKTMIHSYEKLCEYGEYRSIYEPVKEEENNG